MMQVWTQKWGDSLAVSCHIAHAALPITDANIDPIYYPSPLLLVPSFEVACHSRHQQLLLILRGHLDAAKELGSLPGPKRSRVDLTPVDEDISILVFPEAERRFL